MPSYRIGIIGSGNVGSHLCRRFSAAGQKVVMFTRRGASHLLGDVKNLVWTNRIESFRRDFDFVILAVNDASIREVSESIAIEEGIVIHTSGNKSLDELQHCKDRAVLYPLQSFRANLDLAYENIPVFIEANGEKNLARLDELARLFSGNVKRMNSDNRRKLHLAAVIVNNFANHLYSLSWTYLDKSGIDFANLLPLMLETVRRMDGNNPSSFQTGPAIRNDKEVIGEHLSMLKDEGSLQKIYEVISKSISGGTTGS